MLGDYPQETLHHFAQWLNGWLVDWYDFELDSGWRWPNFLDHIPSSRLPQIKFSAISFQRLAFKATLITKVWCFSDIRTTATVKNETEIWQRCTMSFTKRLLTYWLKITCLEKPSDSLKFWLEDVSAIVQYGDSNKIESLMLCKTGLANVELPLGTENNLAFSNRRFEKWPKRLAAEMNHFDKSVEVFY